MNGLAPWLTSRRRPAAVGGVILLRDLAALIQPLLVGGSFDSLQIADGPHATIAKSIGARCAPQPLGQSALSPGRASVEALVRDLVRLEAALTILPEVEPRSLRLGGPGLSILSASAPVLILALVADLIAISLAPVSSRLRSTAGEASGRA